MLTVSAQHGLLARIGTQVRQFICALHGHDSLLHFEQGRLSLLCSSCGYETPGWDVKSAPVQHDPAPVRRRVICMPLIGERRVA